MREEDGQYERLALTHMAHMVQVLHHSKVRETAITPLPIPITPPLEGSGDRHHAITDADEMIRHE